MTMPLQIDPTVATALAQRDPVVALESTVISHGLAYPANVESALRMEQAIRDGGATPATIAILEGRVRVGLSAAEIEQLARLPDVRKCSRRDLPLVVARREAGATTVAATMVIAHAAGIELFATGGIGGVHRGHPFDVSADLYELGRTPVTVVCSGGKSILDLPATRELLESLGVTIIGYGTDSLPAFYAASSGLAADIRVDDPMAAAAIIRARRQLGLHSGTLVGVPVPPEAAMDAAAAERAITQAVAEAEARHVTGAALTPFLLSRIVALTEGASQRANMALLRNNGRVAAAIGAALAERAAT